MLPYSALFVGAALDSAWENRCEDLTRAFDRLRLIGVQLFSGGVLPRGWIKDMTLP